MSLTNLTGVGCLRIHVYSNKTRKTKNNFTKKQYKEFPMIYITGEELVCFVISVEERTAVQWFKSLGKTVRS